MNRRKFLAAALSAPLFGRPVFLARAEAEKSQPDAVLSPVWKRFEVTTKVTLSADAGPAQLWLPLIQTAADYQAALGLRFQSNGRTEILHDKRYGAPVLLTVWDDQVTGPKRLELVETVETHDRGPTAFVPLTEAERKFWTSPTPSAPVDGIVQETVARITAGKTDPLPQVRAIYDWVVDHTHRDPDVPGCGIGDIRQSLTSGNLGGKCADINSLMVGLARAAGFPAREVYGIRLTDSSLYPCLGRSGDVSKAQHCRAEVYLEGTGWFPLDPADVRKAILEQKLALDSPEIRALRDRLFGYWEMNWAGYNSATDIDLPGNGSPKPDFAFLMYPCAHTSQGRLPCLDPAHFHYEITSRDLTA